MVRIQDGSPPNQKITGRLASRPKKLTVFQETGRLAQLAERYPYKVDVSGSSPLATTTYNKNQT